MPLPFVVKPAKRQKRRIGNEQTGIIEVDVRGGLTVYESATVTELLADQQSAFVEGARLADAIAKEEGISLTEAFAVIEGAVSGGEQDPAAEELRVKHADRIAQLVRVYTAAGNANMEAHVTALVRSRCGMPQWSVEETRQLDRVLFNGLWQLAREEQDAENMPVQRVTEEELGKPPAVGGNGRKRTGKPSSGS